MQAHAVDRQPSLFGRRIDDIAARAHAEGIDASSVSRVVRELIRCGAEFLRSIRSVEGIIDQLLRVLHAKTDRKRLRLHTDAQL